MGIRIGIDLGGSKIEGIVLDGSIELARHRILTPQGDYEATLAAIADVVAALESRVAESHQSPIPNPQSRPPVGIGIPGALSPSGLVKNANSTCLIGQPLQRDLEERLGRPVRIANDANCFAVSEATDGAGAGAEVVFGVIIGTGTGGGIVVRGHVLTGPNAIAGEWGHNSLPWAAGDDVPGPPCYCGKLRCIETFLSGPGLASDHERHTGECVLAPDIVARARVGDPPAALTLERYEHRMARALASVINVIDPDVIVLGGGLSNIERLYTNVPRLWDEYVFAADRSARLKNFQSPIPNPQSPTPQVKTRLLPARHGDSSGVRGAAWLWA